MSWERVLNATCTIERASGAGALDSVGHPANAYAAVAQSWGGTSVACRREVVERGEVQDGAVVHARVEEVLMRPGTDVLEGDRVLLADGTRIEVQRVEPDANGRGMLVVARGVGVKF